MKPVVCFGEINARHYPPGQMRFRQAMPGTLDVTFAGAEANAAVTVAALGGSARFVTALPRNEIAEACLANVRANGVDTSAVVSRDTGRLGLYFLESGANQRPGNVLYDRDGSAFCLSGPDAYDWNAVLRDAAWFHTSGVSPSVSQPAAQATIAAARAAQAAGVPVSLDLNFRRKLWRWNPAIEPGELARRTLTEILPTATLVTGNPSDLAHVAEVDAPAEGDPGALNVDGIAALARALVARFPNVRRVAVTLREGCSATHNRWGAILYLADEDRAVAAPMHKGKYAPFDIPKMVDRLGTGDAFAGGLIFAALTPDLAEPGHALRFAVAASCLAHSIKGDFNFCTRAEVEALMGGDGGGGMSR